MNFPVKPLEEVNAKVRTSEMTQAMEIISRNRIGRSIIVGMIEPPVDWERYHGGGFCERQLSNSTAGSTAVSDVTPAPTAAAFLVEITNFFISAMYCDVPQFNHTTNNEQ
jgi:hypothetical protein